MMNMHADSNSVKNVMAQPIFSATITSLKAYKNRTSCKLPSDFWQRLHELKKEFVDRDDQVRAKVSWCLETIGRIQDNFICAFLHIRSSEMREAWDLLASCETGIVFLDRHYIDSAGEFGIEHVRTHVKQWQELFHLKAGFSPAFLFEEVYCSVCEKKRTLSGDCDHETGEIYNGEMCINLIRKARVLHISIVDSPAQKYSVIWPENENAPQFLLLRRLADELLSPWDEWAYHKEIRRSHHPLFANVACDASCPCGSGREYIVCCMQKHTIPDFPHFDFKFSGLTRGNWPGLTRLGRGS